MSETAEDRIFNAIEGLRVSVEDFRKEFNIRMYIGNGKPAVMTSLSDHEKAIEELNMCIAKNNNAVLREKEEREKAVSAIRKEIEPLKDARKGMSFIKRHWKGILVLFLSCVIILLILWAGIVYLNSKLPALNQILQEIAKSKIIE